MKTVTTWVLAVGCAGCLHTQEVDRGDVRQGQPPAKASAESGPEQAAPSELKPVPAKAAHPTTSVDARPPVEAGRPELSVSPTGLMQADGPLLIQRALAKKGYLPAGHDTGVLDQETSAALRKFQTDEKVARTGAPDRETVRRLGLSVDAVFRSSKGAAR